MEYKKILVTGGSGMVGRSLQKLIPDATYISSKDYNLTDEQEVIKLFSTVNPDAVVHLAARVGGIMDNINRPADYFDENILMNSLLVKYARVFNVNRFIGILSTCIYPDIVTTYPILEHTLHDGAPAPSNFSYAYAKRCLGVQINAYNKQHGTRYQYLTPCNLYGEHDKYDDSGHFIAALIKKIHLAKMSNKQDITLMGDGSPLRQFMHSDDLAYVIWYCLTNDIYDNMNVAVEENLSIKEMAEIAKVAMNADDLNVIFDTSKPNGQLRKDVSIELLKSKIPTFSPIMLKDGIQRTYKYLLENNIL